MHPRDRSYIPTYYLQEHDEEEEYEEEEVYDQQQYAYYPYPGSTEKSRQLSQVGSRSGVSSRGRRGRRGSWFSRYVSKRIFGTLFIFVVVMFSVFCVWTILLDPDNFLCAPIITPQVYGVAPPYLDIVGRIWVSPNDLNTLPILDCYLQKNLVAAGGWMTRYEFVVSGEANSTLVSYVRDTLVPSSSGYTYLDLENATEESAYDNLIDNTLYLKIDGDIVFIQQGSITKLLQTTIENGIYQWEVRMLQANVVGMSSMGVRSKASGALWPFLPTSQDSAPSNLTTWRLDNTQAENPQTNADGQWNWDSPQSLELTNSGGLRSWGMAQIPQIDLDETPVLGIQDDDPFGNCTFLSPLCMIQEHYSFLYNLQNSIDQDVPVYIMPPVDEAYMYCPLFLYSPRDLVPLHFTTFWPSTVLPEQISKQYLFSQSVQPNSSTAADVYKQGTSRVGVVTGALAVKYGYPAQLAGLNNTDLLERYKLLAEDMCAIEEYYY